MPSVTFRSSLLHCGHDEEMLTETVDVEKRLRAGLWVSIGMRRAFKSSQCANRLGRSLFAFIRNGDPDRKERSRAGS